MFLFDRTDESRRFREPRPQCKPALLIAAMTIPAGTYLGPYKILNQLGSGATGVVYRAKDTRLGREVAVKVISASYINDPAQHHRLEQEARASGALSHPNILAVFDIGAYEGSPFVV